MQPAPAEILTNQSPTILTPPPVGATWPDQGGFYAGIIRGEDEQPNYHLVLLSTEATLTFDQALEFAKENNARLPTCDELRLLYVNAKDQFQPDWHWSCEQYAANPYYAWVQSFALGGQGNGPKSNEYRVRLVRSVSVIQ